MNTQNNSVGPVAAREVLTDLAGRTASKAVIQPRHRRLIATLVLMVGLPVIVVTVYLLAFARPQYASDSGFVVRQEEGTSASAMLGGLTQMLGAQTVGNSDLVFEFIQSQGLVRGVQRELDILVHYSESWPWDPFYSVRPDATIEELVRFWRRMVRITYDKSSGMIMIKVRARTPEKAQTIAKEIIAQSEAMINKLNETARRDSMSSSLSDLENAAIELRKTREALIEFQARTQILDPQADIQGRMGVVANLQQQLAQALVDYDLVLQSTGSGDPRVRQLDQRIAVIKDRIAKERKNTAALNVAGENTNYPTLLSQYEGLRVDVQFAEEIYRAALTALAQARTNAERQQIYLATFIAPTFADTAEYPRNWLLISLTAFFALMVWSVSALVYYSMRDRG
ncbi:sugar transporter [Seohaeicola saemankumensis]|uniref:sugar transporter n=1 Tax=Seohaeicola TaxID=481178 RepID=UPI0035D02E0F